MCLVANNWAVLQTRSYIFYFRRLFCRGDKFMCRETFPNRNEYYTQSCVFIDNNNNYNNGSSGNNHCYPPPYPWQTHTHTPVPFPEISRASKITPLSWLIVHSYLARTTCQNFTSPSVVFTIIQILSKYLGTYTIDIHEQT